jgi:two-component system sensor histidine kinase BaeS
VTELNSTCELAVARIQTLAREHNVRVELVNHGLQAIHLRADPEDLEMVWVNLLENAVRYSPPGGKVVMRVEKNGGESASVSVEDFGPGIPQEDLPYIFDRFRRADPSRARSTGGFGLGLAICKAFVTAYGGRIEARRRSVQGTEMRVYLPAESS